MPGEREGYVRRGNKLRKERLKNFLRKDPYCETKILSRRFGFCNNVVQDERKKILKELGLEPLNTVYITVQEARKNAPIANLQWYPLKKKRRARGDSSVGRAGD